MIMLRSLHPIRPWPKSGTCFKVGITEICWSGTSVTAIELDIAEQDDLSVWRTLNALTENERQAREIAFKIGSIYAGYFLGVDELPQYDIINVHAAIGGDMLDIAGMRGYNCDIKEPKSDTFYTNHMGAISIIDYDTYMDILNTALYDNEYMRMVRESSEVIIGEAVRTYSIMKIVYDNPEIAVKVIKQVFGIELSPYEVREALQTVRKKWTGIETQYINSSTQTLLAVLDYWAGKVLGYDEWWELEKYDVEFALDKKGLSVKDFEDRMHVAVALIADKAQQVGLHNPKYEYVEVIWLAAIDRRYGHEEWYCGCDVWRHLREFLPEREWSELASVCST